MKKIFTDDAWDDYEYWLKQNDKRIIKRIHTLIVDIDRNGHNGIGKPEPLKYELSGWWSRRITDEHRLVYRIVDNSIEFISMRYHYR
jgi:toxin YoeB